MSTLCQTDGRPSISARDGEGGKRHDFESKKIFCPPDPPPPPPPRAALAAATAAGAGTPTPTIISVSDRLVNRRSDKLYIWAAIGGAKCVKFSQCSLKTCHSLLYEIFLSVLSVLVKTIFHFPTSLDGANKQKSHCGRKLIPPPPSLPPSLPSLSPLDRLASRFFSP